MNALMVLTFVTRHLPIGLAHAERIGADPGSTEMTSEP